ncbi:nucleoside-diphosphate-sugar epimerase [Campylobacter blaseri]|uniref:TIGR01777 family protein n=1 Tax=Campylobacter blaseri TaxID=2042961 RepID=A0A2P8QZS2_9BACT|nr:TIGR01777 family oxidoreductase [Campylobacter blaseri]PSM51738.1 TIGR01777 family protein [Campylobacter blaseri]PSM53529.1 TIGR01777 family protein [Campylobacter blaseri]QKF86339.1 nucleoside-diphosphate-sugar epimerase [Campylobacter blaseri]
MKIAISGSTGMVGRYLKDYLGVEVIGLTREILADDESLLNALKDCDGIINLAGATISKKWTDSYKKELYESRIQTTKKIVNALGKLDNKPKVFISTSAVGIYEDGFSSSEKEAIYGNDFLANLAKDWEKEALRAKNELGIKTTIFRFGVVLSKSGGALKQMELPFKLGLGGKIGNGKNIISWIHIKDLAKAIKLALNEDIKDDIYNLTSPNSISNEAFSKELASALNRPMFFTIPVFVLKLKLKEGVTVLTSSVDAKPKKLLDNGFKFEYPLLKEALSDIYS